tara:strand:+ start:381 stop:1592 length:1212 start_codon:yes stop_codon:yes gene_type:complete
MASATNMTAWDNALKIYYQDKPVIDTVYKNHPFLTLVPKNPRFKGKSMPIPVIFGRPQGVSANFANAQSNASATQVAEFLLTRKKHYGVATVDGETLLASQGNEYAFLDAATTEIDQTAKSVGDALSRQLFRSSDAAIGKVNNSSFGVTTLDLVTDSDALNFEIGMVLQVSATQTGGSVRSGTLEVSAVSRDATSNQVTMTGNLSAGISAIAQNDFVYVQGNYDAGVSGLADWIPASAPGGTAFFGQDRSKDPSRLGGQRQAFSSTREETIINGLGLAAREGGAPDHIFVSFTDFIALEKELQSTVQREVDPETGSGYRSLEMYAPYGIAKIIPDKDCPVGVAYALQMDTWQLATINETVSIIDVDGNRMLRQSSDDGVEIRVGFYGQLGCSAPGFNCRIALA